MRDNDRNSRSPGVGEELRERSKSVIDNVIANIIAAGTIVVAGLLVAAIGFSGWSQEQILLAAGILLLITISVLVTVRYVYSLRQQISRSDVQVSLLGYELHYMRGLRRVDAEFTLRLPDLMRCENDARVSLFAEVLTNMLKASAACLGPDVQRAVLLLPDSNQEYLIPQAHYGLPPESFNRLKFYIGDGPDRKHGVAGMTFKDKKIRVVHVKNNNETDNIHYIEFDETREFIPYKAFVAVPIMRRILQNTYHTSDNVPCLGVVCFDSLSNSMLFEKPNSKGPVLRKLAELFAIAILTNEELSVLTGRQN